MLTRRAYQIPGQQPVDGAACAAAPSEDAGHRRGIQYYAAAGCRGERGAPLDENRGRSAQKRQSTQDVWELHRVYP